MPRRLIALLTAALALGPAASAARAGWIPTQAIDGPNAVVQSVGGVDIARDGTGGVAYLRVDGDLPHVFVSRLTDGAWRAPERLDLTTGAATEVKIAAGDGYRLAVAWIADGMVYASVAQGGGPAPGAFGPVTAIGGPGAASLDLDLGVNGAAYAVWQQAGDVRAARLQDSTWSPIGPSLDINPADVAGTGALRPRVAVSAEGYAVATWGETGPAGNTHVFARRLTGLNLSVVPQDLTLDTFGGLLGGNADSPDIDIEDDGSFAWVAFREDIGGVSRVIARRLVGSQFEAPEAIDGGQPATEPRVDINGDGDGAAVVQIGGSGVFGAVLDHNQFLAGNGLDTTGSTLPPGPELTTGDHGDIAIAWRVGLPDGSVQARGRFRGVGEAFGPETVLSRPELGPVADPGVFVGGDRIGDFAVAMVQGAAGARTLAIASYDRPPGAPYIAASQTYKRRTRPTMIWRPGIELWGAQTFNVFVDGVQIGSTTGSSLIPAQPLTAGKHTWQVVAVDRAGQVSKSRVRTLKIDSIAPTVKVKVSGKRVKGKALKIAVTAADSGGSGLDHVTVDYGDRSATTRTRTTRHHYRNGHFTLKVAAVDKAGNVTRKTVKLTIKKQ
jgi:hypothetical protein